MVIGILWIAIMGVCLQFNYFPDITSSTETLTLGSMSTSINVVAFCNRQLVELILFFAKNLTAAVVHPDSYVLIRADMSVEELAKKDLAARKKWHKRMSRVGSFHGTNKSMKKALSKSFKIVHKIGDRISPAGEGNSRGKRAVGAAAAVAVGAASAAAATVVAVANSAS